MEIKRRAFYNLLRMNWCKDPHTPAKKWQVEDYRSMDLRTLFQRLEACGLVMDKNSFVAYAENVDTPEELTTSLIENLEFDVSEGDRIYLLIFEIWRKLLPEKLCLSIFCDELDHQIYQYDVKEISSAESIQDVVAYLQKIMDENVDDGIKPTEIFSSIGAGCANDLESFLYDYIAEQIDSRNYAYSSELVEGFEPYLKGNKWIELLKARVLEFTDEEAAHDILRKIVLKAARERDLAFNLEVLSCIVQSGENGEFKKMVRKTVSLLKKEEDFRDLLSICRDYFCYLDQDQKERKIATILKLREQKSPHFDSNDPDLEKLLDIIK